MQSKTESLIYIMKPKNELKINQRAW